MSNQALPYKVGEKAAKKNMKKKPQGSSMDIYKRLLAYGKPYWPAFLVAVLANVIYSGIDSLFAYLLKPLLDKGFVSPDLKFLHWIPFIIVGLFVVRAIASLAGNYFMAWVGRCVIVQFRREIFQQLLSSPCAFYDRSSSGKLLSMIVYNSAQVASACTDALTDIVQDGCLVIGLLIVMFSISWQLTLIFFISVPVIALAIKISAKRLRFLNTNVQQTMAEITQTAQEAIDGYKVIRTFGAEEYEAEKFNQATKKNIFREMKVVVTKSVSVSTVQLFAVCSLAGIIYVGTHQAAESTLTAGGFTAVMAAMMALMKPMKNLTKVNSTIQRGLAGAESVFELLDLPKEVDEGSLEIPRVRGAIDYQAIDFAYQQSNGLVLKNISLSIAPGDTVALVGRSGSGKSTLVSLLPRFYQAQSGSIQIDGTDLYEFNLKSLRKQFAMVSQHVTLFNDSIANNIAYGLLDDESIDEDKILQAAVAAHAMEFIEKLPEGLHTQIGEDGVLLSGGQRQRIAIARAILKDAPILILDEATSALDTESERHIQAALEMVMRDRTTLVIAHRLSTIENADKIVVLDHGEIVEMGNHQQLLAHEGHYAKLHRMQFRDPQVSSS